MTLHPIPLNFLIYEENFILFLSVRSASIDRPESVSLGHSSLKPVLKLDYELRDGWLRGDNSWMDVVRITEMANYCTVYNRLCYFVLGTNGIESSVWIVGRMYCIVRSSEMVSTWLRVEKG